MDKIRGTATVEQHTYCGCVCLYCNKVDRDKCEMFTTLLSHEIYVKSPVFTKLY